MVERVFFCRHGHRADDPSNPEGKKTPRYRPLDPDLSPIGRAQARELGQHLAGKVDRIYASPFLRTVRTACTAAEEMKVPVVLEWGFAEHFYSPELFGEWPGTIAPQHLAAMFPSIDLSWEPTGVMPTCWENYWQMHDRCMKALGALLEREDGNALIVTHGAPACTMPAGLVGWDGYNATPYLCGLWELERKEGGWRLVRSSDTSHLSHVAV